MGNSGGGTGRLGIFNRIAGFLKTKTDKDILPEITQKDVGPIRPVDEIRTEIRIPTLPTAEAEVPPSAPESPKINYTRVEGMSRLETQRNTPQENKG